MDLTRDALVAAARDAALSADPSRSVRVLLQALVADPAALRAALGTLDSTDEAMLYEDETVSVWHCRFWPSAQAPPHEHRMPAFIGVYRGTEVNTFYRRDAAGLTAVGTRAVRAGEVLCMGGDGVHSVGAAGAEPSYALHVYLGPLSAVPRSLFCWDSGKPLPFTDETFKALTRPGTASAAG